MNGSDIRAIQIFIAGLVWVGAILFVVPPVADFFGRRLGKHSSK